MWIDKNNNIYHFCSTEGGSSGAPILNLENFKVIGIHRGHDYFEKEIFRDEIKLKYENDFNKDNKLLCNKGKILKEPIINFLKNKITLTLKINIEDIDKKIYFLQNPVEDFEKEEYKININNFVIFINDKIYENKN